MDSWGISTNLPMSQRKLNNYQRDPGNLCPPPLTEHNCTIIQKIKSPLNVY